MRHLLPIAALVSFCLFAFASGPAYAGYNLIQNGSFEDAGIGCFGQGREIGASGGWYVQPVPDSEGGYSIDISLDNAADGNKKVDLEGSWSPSMMGQPYVLSGGVSQELNTTAGTEYTLSFMMRGNYAPGESLSVAKWLQILWNDTPFQDYSFQASEVGEDTWVYHQLTIPGRLAMGNDKLTIKSINITAAGTGYGAMIDDVQMYAVVPEPSTLTCLLAIPMLLLLTRRLKSLDE